MSNTVQLGVPFYNQYMAPHHSRVQSDLLLPIAKTLDLVDAKTVGGYIQHAAEIGNFAEGEGDDAGLTPQGVALSLGINPEEGQNLNIVKNKLTAGDLNSDGLTQAGEFMGLFAGKTKLTNEDRRKPFNLFA